MNTLNRLAERIASTQKKGTPLVYKATVVTVHASGLVDISLFGAVIPNRRNLSGTTLQAGDIVTIQRNGADAFISSLFSRPT